MGKQQDIKIKPIRSYYNENDKENSDYDQVLPISVFDAIYETTAIDSANLTAVKAQIETQLNNLKTTKQNVIPSGTSGNIVIFTDEDGVFGNIPKTDIIVSDITAASSNKLVTEKAIATYHENVLKPEISNVGGLADKVTALEADRTTIQNNVSTLTTQVTGVSDGLALKADKTVVDDIRIIAEGKLDAADLNTVKADVAQAKLDIQSKITKNAAITPGSFTKVLVDANGLVTSGSNLVAADIPAIDIAKVTGLSDAIGAKADASAITGMQDAINGKVTANAPITAGTATKVTYDTKGLVTGSTPLVAGDIPTIDIDKVQGLRTALDTAGSASSIEDIRNQLTNKVNKNADIVAGSGTKITYDAKGLVTGGSALTIEDIPATLTNKVNTIESQLPSFALKESLDGLTASVNGKMTANADIAPGTATKVTYDAKGLITGSTSLVAADIPAIDIAKVTGLSDAIGAKADASAITGIQNDITSKVTGNAPIVAGSGTKITYDAKGLVTAGSNLTEADVPAIPISKVTGLTEALAGTGSSSTITEIQNQLTQKVDKNVNIVAGTATKVTYDAKGLVTGGASLIESDLPALSINKTTNLQTTLDAKVNKNADIVAGSGTKITYDAKGLVTAGSNLTEADVPALSISKITTLQTALDSKATIVVSTAIPTATLAPNVLHCVYE